MLPRWVHLNRSEAFIAVVRRRVTTAFLMKAARDRSWEATRQRGSDWSMKSAAGIEQVVGVNLLECGGGSLKVWNRAEGVALNATKSIRNMTPPRSTQELVSESSFVPCTQRSCPCRLTTPVLQGHFRASSREPTVGSSKKIMSTYLVIYLP